MVALSTDVDEISIVENATVAAVIVAQRWAGAIAETTRGSDPAEAPKVMVFNFVYEAVSTSDQERT